MSDAFQDFDNRLKRIGKTRVKLARGYESVVGPDGLIIAKPKRPRGRFPVRGVFLMVVGFIGFKALILATLGQPVFEDRVATLRAGSFVEQTGAVIMQADPLTVMIAEKLRGYLH